MTFVYFLKHRFGVDRRLHDFFAYVRLQTEDKAKYLRSNNGGEYESNALNKYLKQRGILFEKTEPYTAQQLEIAVKINSTLLDKAQSTMQCTDVFDMFWANAAVTAACIRSLTPSAILNWQTS